MHVLNILWWGDFVFISMRRDLLASGEASSQTYVASAVSTPQLQWDLAFMPPKQFCWKYQITTNEYKQLCN